MKNSTVLLTTAFTMLLAAPIAFADNSSSHMQGATTEKMPHEHELGTGSENTDLFEKLPEGKSQHEHEIGNSENGKGINEKLEKGSNADGHHDLEEIQKQ